MLSFRGWVKKYEFSTEYTLLVEILCKGRGKRERQKLEVLEK